MSKTQHLAVILRMVLAYDQLLAVILCIVVVEYASPPTTPCGYIMYSCCRMSLGEQDATIHNIHYAPFTNPNLSSFTHHKITPLTTVALSKNAQKTPRRKSRAA